MQDINRATKIRLIKLHADIATVERIEDKVICTTAPTNLASMVNGCCYVPFFVLKEIKAPIIERDE